VCDFVRRHRGGLARRGDLLACRVPGGPESFPCPGPGTAEPVAGGPGRVSRSRDWVGAGM
jgi:hypothetical protein